MNLEHKVIVVTGGTSGLGEAAIRYFVQEKKAKAVIFDLNDERGSALVEELGSDLVLFAHVDVTSEEMVIKGISQAVDKFGAIHACINCAGLGTPSKIIEKDGTATSLEKFTAVVNVNLIGLFNVMSKCAAQMAKNDLINREERGAIINISSGAAYEGQIGQCAYAASKSGVIGLNMPAARELGRNGIRVNAIAPGMFLTPMMQTLEQKVIDRLGEIPEFPNRMGDVGEFAHLCGAILENSYLNGETIRLDAATRMSAK